MSDVRVRPDIVFTRVRVTVFVDGCFFLLERATAFWVKESGQ